jgi:hypothetical protein
MTYATLQTDIAARLNRTDLTSKIPGFIATAEAMLFRELQIRELQATATGTTTADYADLPADFGTVSKVTTTVNGYTRSLDYIAEPATSSGITYPNSYSLELNKLRIWGAGTGTAYTLYYVPAIQPLSDSNTTNWLLTNGPDVYLYAGVSEGARYLRNKGLADESTAVAMAGLDSLQRFAMRRGLPMTGSMQIKAR